MGIREGWKEKRKKEASPFSSSSSEEGEDLSINAPSSLFSPLSSFLLRRERTEEQPVPHMQFTERFTKILPSLYCRCLLSCRNQEIFMNRICLNIFAVSPCIMLRMCVPPLQREKRAKRLGLLLLLRFLFFLLRLMETKRKRQTKKWVSHTPQREEGIELKHRRKKRKSRFYAPRKWSPLCREHSNTGRGGGGILA